MEHVIEQIGLVSPGVGRYNVVHENTFDKTKVTELMQSPFE